MTVGAGISAKGLTSGSDLSELTEGTENSDGSVTYTFTDLSQFSKLFIEYRIPSSVTTAPTAKSLTYSGTAQELVTAGEAIGGEMQYALGTETEATGPYTTSIPTATDAGT